MPSTSVNHSVGLSIQIFTQERQCAVGTRVHCLWRTPHTVCSSGGGLIAYRILDNVIKIKEKTQILLLFVTCIAKLVRPCGQNYWE